VRVRDGRLLRSEACRKRAGKPANRRNCHDGIRARRHVVAMFNSPDLRSRDGAAVRWLTWLQIFVT
jgi:hypothetical protein